MSKFNYEKVKLLATELLIAVGEDPERAGLKDTPRRYADMWKEFIEYEPGRVGVTFAENVADQIVTVSGIQTWSLCEHHLLPFRTQFTIAYVPRNKVIGLSKFARIAHKHAHKLQLQERLTHDIAKEVQEIAGVQDVAIIGKGEHLCMLMRGIKTAAEMNTMITWGVFRTDPVFRAMLMSLIDRER